MYIFFQDTGYDDIGTWEEGKNHAHTEEYVGSQTIEYEQVNQGAANGRKLNKDYATLAAVYSQQQYYRYTPENDNVQCYLCEAQTENQGCEDVFFPCEHRCVCRNCIKEFGIGPPGCNAKSGKDGGEWCHYCPVCKQMIAKVVSVDKVKNVVRDYGSLPNLPDNFPQLFQESASMLKAHVVGSTSLPTFVIEEVSTAGDYFSDHDEDDTDSCREQDVISAINGEEKGPSSEEDVSSMSLPQLRKKCVEMGLQPKSWFAAKLVEQIMEARNK
jgi:hypothetical protein